MAVDQEGGIGASAAKVPRARKGHETACTEYIGPRFGPYGTVAQCMGINHMLDPGQLRTQPPDIATMAKQLEVQGALIQTLQPVRAQVIARKTFSFIVASATVQWFLFPAILALQTHQGEIFRWRP